MIKGLLIDLDGVIYNDSVPIEGAAQTINWLQKQNIPFRFITNTTMKSRSTLQKKLRTFGIAVPEEEIFSAVTATAQYVEEKNAAATCYFLLTQDAKKEFSCSSAAENDQADFVIVGDLGDGFSYKQLNQALRHLLNGAKLLALQKNRFWVSDDGYKLDAGAFVALLEFAAHTEAVVLGKPAGAFFVSALKSLGLPPNEVLMIGDDMESDILGAKALGLHTCLVRTGKYRSGDENRFKLQPDMIIPGIWNLPNLTLFSNSKI